MAWHAQGPRSITSLENVGTDVDRELLPIDIDNNRVQCKRRRAILAPYGRSTFVICWGMIVVINAGGHNKKPSYNGGDLIKPDSSRIMAVSLGERVDCIEHWELAATDSGTKLGLIKQAQKCRRKHTLMKPVHFAPLRLHKRKSVVCWNSNPKSRGKDKCQAQLRGRSV